MTQESLVFEIVKAASGPVNLAYVASRSGLSRDQTSYTLLRLRRKKWIAVRGRNHAATYTQRRYGSPKDGRGHSPGSLAALRLNNGGFKGGPARARSQGFHPRTEPTTEIEKAWGWGV